MLANAAIGKSGLKLFIETCDMDVALTDLRMELIRGYLTLKLTVKGVENDSDEIFLTTHCTYTQRFYCSKPVPAAETEKLLTKKNEENHPP